MGKRKIKSDKSWAERLIDRIQEKRKRRFPFPFYIFSSRYFWWKIMFCIRASIIALLPPAALIADRHTTTGFFSKSFATTAALLSSNETLGASLMTGYEFLKAAIVAIPLLTLFIGVEATENGYAWSVLFCAVMFLGSFFHDGASRKLSLLLFNSIMITMGKYWFDGHVGPGNKLVFPIRLVAEFTLGGLCGVFSTLVPFPKLAGNRADKKMKEAAENLSLCFAGLCDTFFCRSNLQRRVNMVHIQCAQRAAMATVEDIRMNIFLCRFEPQSLDKYYLRLAKSQLLGSFPPLVDATLRVLEAVGDDPFILHGSSQAEAFGVQMGADLKELAAAVEEALTLIGASRDKKKFFPNYVPKEEKKKKDNGNKNSNGGGDDGSDAGYVHPFRRVRSALKALELTFAKARRDIYYTVQHPSCAPAQPIAIAEGGGGGVGAGAANFWGQIGDRGITLTDFDASRNDPFNPITSSSSVGCGTTGGVSSSVPLQQQQQQLHPSYAKAFVYDIAPGSQEFGALLAFYIFTLSQFGKKIVALPDVIEERRRGKTYIGVFWEEIFTSFISVFQVCIGLLAFVCPRSWFPSVPPVKALMCAIKLRESFKIALAMGLSQLFYYYTDRRYAFLNGPQVLCFVVSNTSSEAVYASVMRLFGTLFGGIVGFFFAGVTHTPTDRVIAMIGCMLFFNFFRTGKQYGGAAVYAGVVVVPMLTPTITSAETVARISQVTFAVVIYTFVTILLFPTRPLVELAKARMQGMERMRDAIKAIMGTFAAPMPCAQDKDEDGAAASTLAVVGADGVGAGGVASPSPSSKKKKQQQRDRRRQKRRAVDENGNSLASEPFGGESSASSVSSWLSSSSSTTSASSSYSSDSSFWDESSTDDDASPSSSRPPRAGGGANGEEGSPNSALTATTQSSTDPSMLSPQTVNSENPPPMSTGNISINPFSIPPPTPHISENGYAAVGKKPKESAGETKTGEGSLRKDKKETREQKKSDKKKKGGHSEDGGNDKPKSKGKKNKMGHIKARNVEDEAVPWWRRLVSTGNTVIDPPQTAFPVPGTPVMSSAFGTAKSGATGASNILGPALSDDEDEEAHDHPGRRRHHRHHHHHHHHRHRHHHHHGESVLGGSYHDRDAPTEDESSSRGSRKHGKNRKHHRRHHDHHHHESAAAAAVEKKRALEGGRVFSIDETPPDPLLAAAATAVRALDGLIAKVSAWMPLAETEPTVSRVPFPTAASKEYQATIMRMRSLLELMVEALRTLRTRGVTVHYHCHCDATTSATNGNGAPATVHQHGRNCTRHLHDTTPSRYLLAALEDLGPLAAECADNFVLVVQLIVIKLSPENSGGILGVETAHKIQKGLASCCCSCACCCGGGGEKKKRNQRRKRNHYRPKEDRGESGGMSSQSSDDEPSASSGGPATDAGSGRGVMGGTANANDSSGSDSESGGCSDPSCNHQSGADGGGGHAPNCPHQKQQSTTTDTLGLGLGGGEGGSILDCDPNDPLAFLRSERLVSASLAFEEQCLELHFQKALAWQQLVRLSRAVYFKQMELYVRKYGAALVSAHLLKDSRHSAAANSGSNASFAATAGGTTTAAGSSAVAAARGDPPVFDVGPLSPHGDDGRPLPSSSVSFPNQNAALVANASMASAATSSAAANNHSQQQPQNASFAGANNGGATLSNRLIARSLGSAMDGDRTDLATITAHDVARRTNESGLTLSFTQAAAVAAALNTHKQQLQQQLSSRNNSSVAGGSTSPSSVSARAGGGGGGVSPSSSTDAFSAVPNDSFPNLFDSSFVPRMLEIMQQQVEANGALLDPRAPSQRPNGATGEEDEADEKRRRLREVLAANGGRFPTPVALWTEDELDVLAEEIVGGANEADTDRSSDGPEAATASRDPQHRSSGGNDGNNGRISQPRKLKMLLSSADSEGLHTFTFCLVMFSKEAKRLIMSVEGLQQHMLALE